MTHILEIKNIQKSYAGKVALDDVSLLIPKGEIFGLLGPNGAGKTSLIRLINQITLPDGGEIIFDGKPLENKHIGMIGYMPEERGLYKSMKVGEQALYLAQLKGMSKADAKVQLKYWFDKFEIGDWWNKKIQELSKGMAQKVQFIVTVLHRPEFLILDEPFSGFDPVNANLIKDEIIQLNQEGTTIMLSTHRMESVEEMCDSIALIHQSKKVLEGKLFDVKKQFRTNSYEVGVMLDDSRMLEQELKQQGFDPQPANFKTLDNDVQWRVHLGQKNRNDLMELVLKHGAITHFREEIPSVNDIFIKTVSKA